MYVRINGLHTYRLGTVEIHYSPNLRNSFAIGGKYKCTVRVNLHPPPFYWLLMSCSLLSLRCHGKQIAKLVFPAPPPHHAKKKKKYVVTFFTPYGECNLICTVYGVHINEVISTALSLA